MARKSRRPADKSVPISVTVSKRDSETLKKFALENNSPKSGVIKEAIDALREKRAYAAKRAIERPALSPKPAREIAPDYVSALREYVPNHLAERPRLTTNIDSLLMKGFEALAEQRGQTKAEALRILIEDVLHPSGPDLVRSDVVERRTQVIFFSTLLITALEEALDYDPRRHHNKPPPALRLDDESYLNDIRTLIGELRRLNENLEGAAKAQTKPKAARKPAPREAAEKSVIQVSKHVNTFLNRYASALATGAAALTIGTAGALLHQLGVPFDAITKAIRH